MTKSVIAPGSKWRLPDAAEATIYEIVDAFDTPPTLVTNRVHQVRDIYVAVERGAGRASALGTTARVGRRRVAVVPRSLVDFTPAAAWARYIEQQESHIEDLEQEIELRRRYLRNALTEHVKVGPSGPPPRAA